MRRANAIRSVFRLAIAALLLAWSNEASAVSPSISAARRSLEPASDGPLHLTFAASERLRFLAARRREGVRLNARSDADAFDRVSAFLETYGAALGLPAPDRVVELDASGPDVVGMEHVRLQQTYDGIPISGAQLTVHLSGDRIVALHSRSVAEPDVDPIPALTSFEASAIAARMTRTTVDSTGVTTGAPRLEIFTPELLGKQLGSPRLAWIVDVSSPSVSASLWIDARSGDELFRIDHVQHALTRIIYGGLPPNEPARSEGDPPTGDQDVDYIYDIAGDVYQYFLSEYGRDSYDDRGSPMQAIANVTGTLSSYWSDPYVIAADRVVTDDAIAHEFTHGVVQYSSGQLFGPAGGSSMNESYADIFGETIDLLNGRGNDSPEVRWALFEDFAGARGWRHMMNPTMAASAGPGKVSDPEFICDHEGSHQNGGIGNHAYALMTDGGSYDHFVIRGIGLTKAASIEYRAVTVYLTASSTFQDDYSALLQSCDDLVGTDGLSEADCGEVRKALDAVQMDFAWPCPCGNGELDVTEACDDGNATDGDGCDSNCTATACGNGVVSGDEQCDRGSCCTDACRFAASETVCADDGTSEYRCNGSGDCLIVPPTPSPTTSPTSTATDTPSATPTATLAATATPTADVTAAACAGNCDADAKVTLGELLTAVRIALGLVPMSACRASDVNGDGLLTIDELTAAVRSAIDGCRR